MTIAEVDISAEEWERYFGRKDPAGVATETAALIFERARS
jgi:hypothetical protein